MKSISQVKWVWPILYTLIVTIGLFALFRNWAYDDPFITYRYAENLASGQGFVYNPGMRVLSTTTPLFTLLLSGVKALGGEIQTAATLIGAFSCAIGGLLLWDLARSWKTPLAGWAGLLLYPTFSLLPMMIGSETPLYLAFCLGAFATYASRHYTWAGLLAALATLTRPDGILVVVILLADFVLTHNLSQSLKISRLPWKAVLLFTAIIAAWFVFAWLYFGAPLPVTLVAKQNQGAMAQSQRFLPGFFTIAAIYHKWPYWIESLLVVLGITAVLQKRIRGNPSPWLTLLAWTAIYFTAYSLLGVSRYFWYYTPLVPAYVIGIGLGISTITTSLHRIRYISLGAFVLIGFFFVVQGLSTWDTHNKSDSRYPIYRTAGEWIAEHTSPEASVGTLEVGIIGYYARRPMIDFSGLIQPDIARQLGPDTTYEDAALWAIDHYNPDYLILHTGLHPRLEQEAANLSCQVVNSLAGADYSYSLDLSIYACP
ncbi:MAG: hypothetical protein JW726_07980 [Anaerolineales bacterium]|nr:hypothetical protein [Anaerolineales bacterium]